MRDGLFLSKYRSQLYFCLIALLLFSGIRLYYRLTDDFRIGNITYLEVPHYPEWEIAALAPDKQETLSKILSQKFYYIGKGAQSYAFASADQRYVLKFFKFKHLRPSLLFGILPKLPFIGEFQAREIARKQRKLYSIFTGYKLGFDRNRQAARLIYVQLNPKNIDLAPVKVIDKIGIERTIDLSTVPFIVQEKGETLRSVLRPLLAEGNVQLAKERILQIFDMYFFEYQKGLFDHDHGVMQNTGFIDGEPFHLDIGKLEDRPEMHLAEYYEPDRLLVANKIRAWLMSNYPQFHDEISLHIDSWQPPELN